MNRPRPRPRPEFHINIWCSCIKPRLYAWQIYRANPHQLLLGSEARSHRQARKDAQAAIRRLTAKDSSAVGVAP